MDKCPIGIEHIEQFVDVLPDSDDPLVSKITDMMQALRPDHENHLRLKAYQKYFDVVFDKVVMKDVERMLKSQSREMPEYNIRTERVSMGFRVTAEFTLDKQMVGVFEIRDENTYEKNTFDYFVHYFYRTFDDWQNDKLNKDVWDSLIAGEKIALTEVFQANTIIPFVDNSVPMRCYHWLEEKLLIEDCGIGFMLTDAGWDVMKWCNKNKIVSD